MHKLTALLSVAVFVLASVLLASPARATVLTYDIRWIGNTAYWGSGYSLITYFSPANPNPGVPWYGDHVAGAFQDLGAAMPDGATHTWYDYGNAGEGYTPNIGVQSSVGTGASMVTYNDGFWPEVAELVNHGHYYITFTPDAGYSVRVNGFNLRSWGAPTLPPPTITADWTIWQGSIGGTVFASSKTNGQGQAGGSANSFSFNNVSPPFPVATNAQFSTTPLILDIDFSGGPAAFFALDDVNFQQAIPEPASLALLAMGGFCLLRRSRRA